MVGYLNYRDIRPFDYAPLGAKLVAEPLRDEVRAKAEQLAVEAARQIEFVRMSRAFRKEEHAQSVRATDWLGL